MIYGTQEYTSYLLFRHQVFREGGTSLALMTTGRRDPSRWDGGLSPTENLLRGKVDVLERLRVTLSYGKSGMEPQGISIREFGCPREKLPEVL